MLTASGLDGCEALTLLAAAEGLAPEMLRQNRGWCPDEWMSATERLTARGVLADGELTPAGRALRRTIEEGTDRLAGQPYRVLDRDGTRLLADVLGPAVSVLLATGVIPFPNPIGLPAPGAPS